MVSKVRMRKVIKLRLDNVAPDYRMGGRLSLVSDLDLIFTCETYNDLIKQREVYWE